ncbi:MAG: RHS repeat protein, partial [Planctomycetes bacterium]|nr:RHS repeat protein [Planctomycetota bacterium]
SVESQTEIYTHCQGPNCTNPRSYETTFSSEDKVWANNIFLEAPNITVSSPEGPKKAKLLNSSGQVTQIKYPYVEMEGEEEPWEPPPCCEMDPEDPESCEGSELCEPSEPPEPIVLELDPVDYAYNTFGHLTAVSSGDLSLNYTFDPAGRLETLSNTAGDMIAYGYDAADRMTLLTTADSNTFGFGYD